MFWASTVANLPPAPGGPSPSQEPCCPTQPELPSCFYLDCISAFSLTKCRNTPNSPGPPSIYLAGSTQNCCSPVMSRTPSAIPVLSCKRACWDRQLQGRDATIMALPVIFLLSIHELEDDMGKAQISNTIASKVLPSQLVLLLGVRICDWSCFRKPMQTPSVKGIIWSGVWECQGVQ